MKKTIIVIILLSSIFSSAQKGSAFQHGEYFLFNMSYGFVNAGKASLELTETQFNDKKVYFSKGYGYTTGMTKLFFPVEDHYHSYFDKFSGEPYCTVRKINEGGYTKDQLSYFDNQKNVVLQKDNKKKTENTYPVPNQVQDVISAFYYLRNHPKVDTIKEGESITINMFFDDEVLNFKLKFLRREIIKTKFGKIATMVFRPYVLKGRVFKESESLTMWVSDDENRIPLKVKADLLVGSLKAELEKCRGIKHPLALR